MRLRSLGRVLRRRSRVLAPGLLLTCLALAALLSHPRVSYRATSEVVLLPAARQPATAGPYTQLPPDATAALLARALSSDAAAAQLVAVAGPGPYAVLPVGTGSTELVVSADGAAPELAQRRLEQVVALADRQLRDWQPGLRVSDQVVLAELGRPRPPLVQRQTLLRRLIVVAVVGLAGSCTLALLWEAEAARRGGLPRRREARRRRGPGAVHAVRVALSGLPAALPARD